MDNFEIQLAIAGLFASKLNNSSFGEIDLLSCGKILTSNFPNINEIREKLNSRKIPDFMIISKVPDYVCPKCKNTFSFDEDLEECLICEMKIDSNKTSLFRLDLNYSKVNNFLIDVIKQKILDLDIKIKKQDANYFLADFSKNTKLGILFCINPRVEDYYFLLGKSLETDCELNVIISLNLNPQLSLWGQMNPNFIFFSLSDFLIGTKFNDIINSKIDFLKTNQFLTNKFEQGEINLLCLDTKEKILSVYDSIIKFALHKGEGDVKKQGGEFERLVITLLNWTFFNTVPYGKKDAPDGAITIHNNSKKSFVVPLDAKSYTGEYDSKINLNDYYSQFRKYISAFKTDEISSRFNCNSFIIFAYDFDINNEYQNTKLHEIETEFNINFVFFPLKTLIYLSKQKFENNIYYVDKDALANFFIGKRYIKETDIDLLIKNILKWQISFESPNIKLIRQIVEKSGY